MDWGLEEVNALFDCIEEHMNQRGLDANSFGMHCIDLKMINRLNGPDVI